MNFEAANESLETFFGGLGANKIEKWIKKVVVVWSYTIFESVKLRCENKFLASGVFVHPRLLEKFFFSYFLSNKFDYDII